MLIVGKITVSTTHIMVDTVIKDMVFNIAEIIVVMMKAFVAFKSCSMLTKL